MCRKIGFLDVFLFSSLFLFYFAAFGSFAALLSLGTQLGWESGDSYVWHLICVLLKCQTAFPIVWLLPEACGAQNSHAYLTDSKPLIRCTLSISFLLSAKQKLLPFLVLQSMIKLGVSCDGNIRLNSWTKFNCWQCFYRPDI